MEEGLIPSRGRDAEERKTESVHLLELLVSGRHTARTPAFGYLWKKINSRLGVFCVSRLSTDTAVSRPFPEGVTISKEKDVLGGNHWLAVLEWLEKPSVLQRDRQEMERLKVKQELIRCLKILC